MVLHPPGMIEGNDIIGLETPLDRVEFEGAQIYYSRIWNTEGLESR